MKKDITGILNRISQNWFLAEPLLFATLCTHQIVENKKLTIPFRTGKLRIEYSPDVLEELSEKDISEFLKIEMFRILLKHPYQRQPKGGKKPYLAIASDITIFANYPTTVNLNGIDFVKEMILRINFMKHGLPNRFEFASQSNDFIYRNVVSKYWIERDRQIFNNEVEKDLISAKSQDEMELEVNGKKYLVSYVNTILTVTDASGKIIPPSYNANEPVKIQSDYLSVYLHKKHATRIVSAKDGVEAEIEGVKYLFQLQEEGYYQVLKYNMLLGRFELLLGTGILEFWRTKVLFADGKVKVPEDMCFEEWYSKILSIMKFMSEEGDEDFEDANTSGSESEEKKPREKTKFYDKLSELSELWEEDDQSQQKINNLIDDAEKAMQWGSVSGSIKELIQVNKTVDINYAEVLRHFSTSILSSNRSLTRMKPNRRFGFERLGSRYSLNSKLLVAVDISSSITKEDLNSFFSIINTFFRYGVEKIDVIQFDTQLQGNVVELKRAVDFVELNGRGGTDFQPVADYYCSHSEYDGMIYLTDGCGPHPKFVYNRKINVLWIFTTKFYYDRGKRWVEEIPGNSCTYIPM